MRKIAAAALGLALAGAAACSAGRLGPSGVTPCARAFVFVDRGRPAAAIEIPEGDNGIEKGRRRSCSPRSGR